MTGQTDCDPYQLRVMAVVSAKSSGLTKHSALIQVDLTSLKSSALEMS